MTTYGIWYDDGHIDSGWLHVEGGNGRSSRWEHYDRAMAEEYAKVQRDRNDPSTIFSVEPIDGESRERQYRCRKLALEHRLARALKSVEEIRASIDHHARRDPNR